MMTKQKMEQTLRMPLLNVCLAAAAGRENDLRDAKNMLIDAVHDLLVTVAKEASHSVSQG